MTNGDKIRSMTDEELAEKLLTHGVAEQINFCQGKGECEWKLEMNEEIPEEWCTQCMLEWMKGESND